MIRQICWKEKHEAHGKTEVRVDFFAGEIKWQFKFPDSDRWNYEHTPSRDQWATLLDEVTRRYQRGRARIEDIRRVERKIAELPPTA